MRSNLRGLPDYDGRIYFERLVIIMMRWREDGEAGVRPSLAAGVRLGIFIFKPVVPFGAYFSTTGGS
jgi:hypothetical protein